jgi:integrase
MGRQIIDRKEKHSQAWQPEAERGNPTPACESSDGGKGRRSIMGSMYKRGNTWWIQYYRNGKPYRESSKSSKEVDAKRLLRKREGEISDGKLPGIYFDRVRFDKLAEDFLLDFRVNQKKSVRRVEQCVDHLAETFEGVKVRDITTPRIQAYIEKRFAAGAANATINRELSALKRMLNLGARQTPPLVDRVPYIPMLKENNTRTGFFEHGEYLSVRDALPDYLKPVMTFGYKTGWRLGEILGLTWDKVDLKNGIVRIEAADTKNREARTVYLDDELREMFKEVFAKRRLDVRFVFLKDGKPIQSFRKAWRAACKKMGLAGKLFHDLRRTAVRNMVRAGIPERVAMTLSGHRTRSVFERYNIVSDADLRKATQRQQAYLRGQEKYANKHKTATIHEFAQKRS